MIGVPIVFGALLLLFFFSSLELGDVDWFLIFEGFFTLII